MTDRKYYALAVDTVTGLIFQELPLMVDPTWSATVNDQGAVSIQVPTGTADGSSTGISRDTLRGVVSKGRCSIAVCYGDRSLADPILQCGPIWTHASDDGVATNVEPSVTLGGAGILSLFKARITVPGTWTPAAGFGDGASVATYTGSTQAIAIGVLNDMLARGSLPIDVPTPAAYNGPTTTATYYGYDLKSVAENLQDLTQLAATSTSGAGPDVLMQPYFADGSHVRWRALVGNPTLTQPGTPLAWDYPGTIESLNTASDGSNLATTQFEKGNGQASALVWAYATDPTLTTAGWPLMEAVGSEHADSSDPVALQAWANADLGLYGREVETWTAVVRADLNPLIGTYAPGMYVTYQVTDHHWVLDGNYPLRLLGLANGQNPGELVHVLHAMQGTV